MNSVLLLKTQFFSYILKFFLILIITKMKLVYSFYFIVSVWFQLIVWSFGARSVRLSFFLVILLNNKLKISLRNKEFVKNIT